MKKIILVSMLVLGLIMVLMPTQAFAKINYTNRIFTPGVNKDTMINYINYSIYDYKKFTNIQKADKSKNTYDFFISYVSIKTKNNGYCAVATIFVLNEHSRVWNAARSLCDTGKILIHAAGSIKKGLLDINRIVIRQLITATNGYYKAWK